MVQGSFRQAGRTQQSSSGQCSSFYKDIPGQELLGFCEQGDSAKSFEQPGIQSFVNIKAKLLTLKEWYMLNGDQRSFNCETFGLCGW